MLQTGTWNLENVGTSDELHVYGIKIDTFTKYELIVKGNRKIVQRFVSIDYSLLMAFKPNLRIRNQYFLKLGPSARLRAVRMSYGLKSSIGIIPLSH